MRDGGISFNPSVRPASSLNPAFAGRGSAGAWRLRLYTDRNLFRGAIYGWGLQFNNQSLVNVATTAPVVPARFDLEQNYPNPFNPETVISGQWTADSQVKLVVFDVLGRKVATLANGRYPAGRYSFTFDGTNLASGVYFYRLTAGTYSAVRKMLLVR